MPPLAFWLTVVVALPIGAFFGLGAWFDFEKRPKGDTQDSAESEPTITL